MSFQSLGLGAELLRSTTELGFEKPTPIQLDAIPPALAGRDVLACAMTGSGKSAAFLLPILQRLASQKRGGTKVLILTPTRELAAQIEEHLRQLAKYTRVSAAAVYGGVGMRPQEDAFRKGVDVIVATPGRLLDHFQHSYARLDQLDVLVLDEADRMLDMGFLPDIRRVLKHIPKQRQTLFFSATMPKPIVELSREMLHDPVTIAVERQAAPATGITQSLYPVAEEAKLRLLVTLLERQQIQNAIVFTRTKHRANRLFEQLERHRISAARIHGNRSQAQRTEALAGFKSNRYRILVATDIAARGIDVDALSHVVNFDVPNLPEDYIHRVGRTARAEMTGDAITFVSPAEESDVRAIERAIAQRLPRITVPDFDYHKPSAEKLEIPLQDRIAAIRARKAEDRARANAKAAKRATSQGTPHASGTGQGSRHAQPRDAHRKAAHPAPRGRNGSRAQSTPATHSSRAERRRP